ncbi:MAG: hypothetical protein LUQ50_03810, partial [Methanospirillum sp.]|uniref:CARDB domain-containing protein n=1 Tax=Methanospirillum sp. TaxID=45200 RepID=UPI002374CD30
QEIIPTQPTIVSEEKSIIEGSADLVISDLNATESSCIASEFPITSIIENNGDIDANFFSIHFYLSDDQGITPADKEIGYHEFGSLKPHEKLNIADMLHIPYGTGMRMFSIGAIVDPSNDIYEQNKSNNIAILNHRVQIKDC